MLVEFRTKKLLRCYEESRTAVRAFGPDVARRYVLRINIIKQAKSFEELEKLPGLDCHPLKGNRKGQHAIKLTGFHRLIVTRRGDDLQVVRIEEVSKHYGD